MADAEIANVTDDINGPVALDPFAFFEDISSRIPGLGGSKVGHDPKYVFHTPYVETARGRVSFTVTFHNLKARRGTLALYVNMLALDGKSYARLVTTERLALNRLVSIGGSITIEFEGFRGMSFAIFGHIPDDTDATADGLAVTLNNPPRPGEDDGPIEDARSTSYRSDTLRQTAFILDNDAPTFADPVSQVCTEKQFRERAFADWALQLGDDAASAGAQWEQAYVLQALHRYGLLETGARALGFGVGESTIPTILANRGIDVMATDPSLESSDVDATAEASLAALQTGVAAGTDADAQVTYRRVNFAAIPQDLVNFDLLWSCGILQHLGPIGDITSAIIASMRCLRPGGIAVHTMDVARTLDRPTRPALILTDIERLALVLIGQGHEIARVKLGRRESIPRDPNDKTDQPITSFGFIIRKAATPF